MLPRDRANIPQAAEALADVGMHTLEQELGLPQLGGAQAASKMMSTLCNKRSRSDLVNFARAGVNKAQVRPEVI